MKRVQAAHAANLYRGRARYAVHAEHRPRPAVQARLQSLMRGKLIMDLRNVFDPAAMAQAGLEYHGIGQGVARVGAAA